MTHNAAVFHLPSRSPHYILLQSATLHIWPFILFSLMYFVSWRQTRFRLFPSTASRSETSADLLLPLSARQNVCTVRKTKNLGDLDFFGQRMTFLRFCALHHVSYRTCSSTTKQKHDTHRGLSIRTEIHLVELWTPWHWIQTLRQRSELESSFAKVQGAIQRSMPVHVR